MSDEDVPPEHPFLPHRDFLCRLTLALARDESQAADLHQEVWLAALRRPMREIAHLRDVRGWMRRVAQRLLSNVTRGERRRARRERHVAREEVGEVAADLDLQRTVLDAVRALPEPQRTAIHLRYYKDRSPTAIARALDVSVRTVESRLRRGRELLREALDRECGSRSSWRSALLAAHGLAGSGTAPALTSAGATWATAGALSVLALGYWLVASRGCADEVELAARSTRASNVAGSVVASAAPDSLTAIDGEQRATRSPLAESEGTGPSDTR